MGPYLAIIYDCFSEAFKSRILWVLLIGWTALLGVLAPFGWIEGADFQIRTESITNRGRLQKELQAIAQGRGSDAQKRVWKVLDPEFKSRVEKSASPGGSTINLGRMAEGMSSALDAQDLYLKEAWPTAAARSELTKDLENYRPGSLSGNSLARVNRRLVELAFPTGLKNTSQNSIWFGYAGIKLSNPIPVNREQLIPVFNGVLFAVVKIALGVVGVFIAIVVTSNLIPDMFTPGSMALLLSKPISRSGLLIAKYFGGVFFILINVGYFLVGFYFLLGWRLQIWNAGLFLCIPIFVFVFMIFYSVSVLAGLVWKNAIVSVMVVVLFWGICFSIAIADWYLSNSAIESPQIVKLSTFDNKLFGSNEKGELLYWAANEREWKPIGESSYSNRRVLGPFWLASYQMAVFGRPTWNPIFGNQSDGVQLQSLNMSVQSDDAHEDVSGQPLWSEKRIDSLADLPSATRRVKIVRDMLLAVSESGVYKFDVDAVRENAANDKKEAESQPLFGYLKWPKLTNKQVNLKLTEEDVFFETPIDFCEIPNGEGVLVLSGGTLHRFKWQKEDHTLVEANSMDLNLPEDSIGLIQADSTNCLVFTNKKVAVRIDLQNWTKHDDINPALKVLAPQELYCISDDGFVMLSAEGKVIRIDNHGKSFSYPPQTNHIKAIAIDEKKDIFYCTLGNEVRRLPNGQSQLALVSSPRWSKSQWMYWLFLHPVYTVFPKPPAIDSLLIWSLTSDNNLQGSAEQTDSLKQNLDIDVWTPIWSNALFITVVLMLGCIYLSRQDT